MKQKRTYSYNNKSPDSTNYNLGRFNKSERIRMSELRKQILKVYGSKCMKCFRTDLEMHIDHILPASKYPNLKLDLNNMQVLCINCNRAKSNVSFMDYRPFKHKFENFKIEVKKKPKTILIRKLTAREASNF